MTVEGRVENGHIVLNQAIALPEGMKVRVEFLSNDSSESKRVKSDMKLPSLYDRLKPVVGAIKDLPSDFAINHDHYLHGQPKRQ